MHELRLRLKVEVKRGHMIRILLVDDQPAIRSMLKMRLGLEPDLQVVGEAIDGIEALGWVRNLAPDVVVMDVDTPRIDGLAATEALRFVAPQTQVVILTIHDSARMRDRAREAGAMAFVTKQTDDSFLLNAIRRAGTGG